MQFLMGDVLVIAVGRLLHLGDVMKRAEPEEPDFEID
jgi:hypothetical protein